MQFLKFEDRGAGLCAVFRQEPQANYEYDADGRSYAVWHDTCAFLRPSLEERAINLEKLGADASLERQVLANWPISKDV